MHSSGDAGAATILCCQRRPSAETAVVRAQDRPALCHRRPAGDTTQARAQPLSGTWLQTVSSVRDKDTLARIISLVIPPAWTDVWICPHDERSYPGDGARCQRPQAVSLSSALAQCHARREQVRAPDHFRQGVAGDPPIRSTRTSPCPVCRVEKILATIVRLLETTMMRVGNEEYARSNGSFRPDHAARQPRRIRRGAPAVSFRGKSGDGALHRTQRPAACPHRAPLPRPAGLRVVPVPG